MKNTKLITRALLVAACLLLILALPSCLEQVEVGNNTELSEEFLDCMIQNDMDGAYELIKNTTDDQEFSDYWEEIMPLVEGATSYELKQIGWNVSTQNGELARISAYQVYFDNDKILLLQILTTDDIEGIAGLNLMDVTEFVTTTDAFVPPVNVAMIVLSILSIAFMVWMFVDCMRRKIRRKVLWAILILAGAGFTLSIGEQMGIKFTLSIALHTSSIAADPSLLSVITKIALPVGAIVYFFLRKKLPLKPTPEEIAAQNAAQAAVDYMPGVTPAPVSESKPEEPQTEENRTEAPTESAPAEVTKIEEAPTTDDTPNE